MQCVIIQDVHSAMGTQKLDGLSLPDGAGPGFGGEGDICVRF